MQCAQCGVDLPSGQRVCDACGSKMVRHDITLSHDDTHQLLAEANLFRMRGQHDEAISVSTRILRLDPTSAAAHSLLGDIYRDQGNHREALGWYKLAVQLDPANTTDRKKLDEMIDRVFQGVSTADSKVAPHLSLLPPATAQPADARASAPVWLVLLARLQPIHVVLGCTVLAMLGVLLVFMLARPGRRTEPLPEGTPPTTAPPTTPAPTSQTPPDTRITPPPPGLVEIGQGPNPLHVQLDPPRTTPPETPTPTPTPVTPPPVISPQIPPYAPRNTAYAAENPDPPTITVTALKAALQQFIQTKRMAVTLEGVSIDPRKGAVTFDYSIPPMETLTETKRGLLYAGFQFIWQAQTQDKGLRHFTLHGSADDTKASTLALAADVSEAQAQSAYTARDYPTVAQYLTDPWWRADLVSAPL